MNSMKKNRKKMTLICLLCFSFLLTGCKIGNKEVIVSNTLNNRQVFRIGNVSCGLKEAKVYLVNYQNIYGTAYGLDLWQHDFGDSSLENYVKNITMRELAQVVCLDQLAKEKEMELSEEERKRPLRRQRSTLPRSRRRRLPIWAFRRVTSKSTMSIMRWHRKCTTHSQKR